MKLPLPSYAKLSHDCRRVEENEHRTLQWVSHCLSHLAPSRAERYEQYKNVENIKINSDEYLRAASRVCESHSAMPASHAIFFFATFLCLSVVFRRHSKRLSNLLPSRRVCLSVSDSSNWISNAVIASLLQSN